MRRATFPAGRFNAPLLFEIQPPPCSLRFNLFSLWEIQPPPCSLRFNHLLAPWVIQPPPCSLRFNHLLAPWVIQPPPCSLRFNPLCSLRDSTPCSFGSSNCLHKLIQISQLNVGEEVSKPNKVGNQKPPK